MIIKKIKELCVCILIVTFILTSLDASPVYAIPSNCTSGAFLGFDQNIDTSITNNPNYADQVKIVSFDLCNFNGQNDDTSISGISVPVMRALGKDIYISASMPNPAGGGCNSLMSDADFDILSSTKIQDINTTSSTLLQNYKAMVVKISDILSSYGNNQNVYFRPFQEMNASWFWWGDKDSNEFKNLWINLHDYLVSDNVGCRDLSWLKFCYAANIGDNANTYYPGSNYVDVVGVDGYSDDPANDASIKLVYAQLVGGNYNGVTYPSLGKPFGFPELGTRIGGNYVDINNKQIQKFDYQKWSDAITNDYPKAKFLIVFNGAYDPRDNINGTSLFNNYQDANTNISYKAHISNIGWQNAVSNGEVAGTTGQALPIEAISIDYPNNEGLHLSYQVHVSNIGWMPSVNNNEIAGTTGRALSMEAITIAIKNSSEIDSADYSVYYRAHIQNIGWMNWVKNGEISGTVGKSFHMEAIQICVVKNGTSRALEMETLRTNVN